MAYLPPLALHVAWHPEFVPGETYGEALYRRFARDPDRPLGRGLGVPVRFWTGAPTGDRLPSPAALFAEASRTAVLLLVDDSLVVDDAWCDWAEKLTTTAAKSGGAHRVFPVAFSANAAHLPPEARRL